MTITPSSDSRKTPITTRRVFQVASLIAMLGPLYLPSLIMLARLQFPHVRFLQALTRQHLSGDSSKSTKQPLNATTWFSSAFQDGFSHWFGEQFPGRWVLVRASNQIDYSLLRISSMQNGTLIVGKERQLFGEEYLREYCLITPPANPVALRASVAAMADVAQRLRRHDVPFVVLISPSKASIYSEYIPDTFLNYRQRPSLIHQTRNCDQLIMLLDEFHIPYVNSPRLLHEIRSRDPNALLFVKGGVHWSDLGTFVGTNALMEKFADTSTKPFPQLKCDSVEVNNYPTDQDVDLANLLNVVLKPNRFPAPHPHLRREGESCGYAFVVGGSFAQRPAEMLSQQNLFRRIDLYWYWDRLHWSFMGDHRSWDSNVSIDWKRQVLTADAVVLEINEEAIGDATSTHYMRFLKAAQSNLPR